MDTQRIKIKQKGTLGFGFSLLRLYPLRSSVVLISFLLAGVLEGLGTSSLLPLLSLLEEKNGRSDNLITDLVEKTFSALGVEPTIGVLLLSIGVLFFLKAVFSILAMRNVGYSVAELAKDLRSKLIQSLMRSKWEYYSSLSLGKSTNALTTEVDRASNAYLYFCKLVAEFILILIYLSLAFVMSWQLTVSAIFVGIVLMVCFYKLILMVRKAGRKQTELLSSLTALLADALGSVKPIKAMGRENYFVDLLEKETCDLRDQHKKQVLGQEMLGILRDPCIVIFVATGIYIAHFYINLDFAVLLVFAFMFIRIVQKMTALQVSFQKVTLQESAYWSLLNTIETAEALKEAFAGHVTPTLNQQIDFKNISFGHRRQEGAALTILEDITLTLPAKKLNAIIGPSGSGKTTLVDLVLGFYTPSKGEVLIDGTPLSQINIATWREMVGYVPQDTPLLHDTILNNVTLGRTDIAQRDIENILEQVGAKEFIDDLPKGVNELVGERGLLFSGGQRQRIALARALIRKPSLLILDEATSALDSKTEGDILKALKNISKDVTLLVISHNASILDYADNVFELDGGMIKKAAGRG